jgi:lipopolysaccharide/colanic/teichoic acid biosynthesis glycosyltransferase
MKPSECLLKRYEVLVKRLFDILFAFLGMLGLFPVMILISVWIKLDSPGPVLYRGIRVGKDGKLFAILKFRTMVVNAEKIGGSSTPQDDPRVTSVGGLLRRYKLDELPQLINVVSGEMSLVGPRPQVPWAVELYSEQEKALLNVRPGITDYASIKFADEGEILRGSKDPDKDYLEKIAPEKTRLGLEYVKQNSLWIDLKIILATLWIFVGGDPEQILDYPAKSDGFGTERGRHEVA